MLRLNAEKAGTELHWHPMLRLADALEWVVRWHRAYLAGEDMQAVTLTQCTAYEALLRTGS